MVKGGRVFRPAISEAPFSVSRNECRLRARAVPPRPASLFSTVPAGSWIPPARPVTSAISPCHLTILHVLAASSESSWLMEVGSPANSLSLRECVGGVGSGVRTVAMLVVLGRPSSEFVQITAEGSGQPWRRSPARIDIH